MRRSKVKHVRRHRSGGLTFLTVVGLGGVACLLAGWNAHLPQNAGLSPAEIVALRFPDARNKVWDRVAEAQPDGAADAQAPQAPQAQSADDGDADPYSIFSPYPTMAPPTAAPAPAAYQTASLSSTPVELAPQRLAPALGANVPLKVERRAESKSERKVERKPVAVHARAPRHLRRPGAVLSEAQIASIKSRLNLTPDQQEMWPAVEHALRSLSYVKKPGGGTQIAEIDPDSEEVQRLKSAAFPLIMSFSDEQKHELRVIAHVAGLEKLASQF